jgi:uncharacterized tellurite resistance protein B-like protein
MSKIKRPKNVTVGHCIAFLYLQLASWDGEYAEVELTTVMQKLAEWYTEGDPAKVCVEAFDWVTSCDNEGGNATYDELNLASGFINEKLDVDGKKAILDDLKAIALADGKVMENEKGFFDITAKVFGFQVN